MRNIVKVSIAAAFIFMIGIVILVIFTNNYISGKADNSNEDIATLNNIAVTAEENRQDLSALDKKDFEVDYVIIDLSNNILYSNVKSDHINLIESGMSVEKASWVNAPMVRECFMNLECRFVWEKEIVPGDDHVMLCLEVVGIHIDEDHITDRTGENGFLYNIHYQMDPEKVTKTGHDYAAVLKKKIDVMEY